MTTEPEHQGATHMTYPIRPAAEVDPTGAFERAYLEVSGMSERGQDEAREALIEKTAEKLARFGYHPDPAIDFEIEVQSLEARLIDAENGYAKIGTEPEAVMDVLAYIKRAMEFNVGGDPSAVAAKQTLRGLEHRAIAALRAPAEAEPDDLLEQAMKALERAEDAIANYHRYWTGGETRGSYDGKPERNGLWRAMYDARAALKSLRRR
jgi:hypothetical protein